MNSIKLAFSARAALAAAAILALGAFVAVPAFVHADTSTFYVDTVNGSDTNDGSQATPFATLEVAVSAAQSGDTIDMTGSETVTAPIAINKPLTINGQNSTTLTTSGTGYLFLVTGVGSTIENFSITKSDNTDQNVIGIQANDVTISSNTFLGTFNIGDSQTTRALEVSTVTGVAITGNHITHFRQPAYINDNTVGTVSNNYVSDTKGWVILSDSQIALSGNTWGSNVDDIAIIAGPSDDAGYADLAAISQANSNAFVIDKFGATPRQTGAWVNASSGNDANDGSLLSPLATIGAAVSRVVAGSTIQVAAGTYSGSVTITKPDLTIVGTGSVIMNAGAGYGFDLDEPGNDASGFSLSGFTVNSSAATTYAFKAYKADGLTLTNDTFNGNSFGGGVDVNTTNNVTIANVTASGFHKNGFAFTPAYAAGDVGGDSITLDGITASNNGWTGISFYTVGNDKSTNTPASTGPAASLSHVTFTGTNTFSGNGAGLFVEGDNDANHVASSTTPVNTVTSNGTVLNIGTAAFSGNTVDIENYQTADVNAMTATFAGKVGSNMTSGERTTEDAKIIDSNDHAFLGTVDYVATPEDCTFGFNPTTYTSGGSSTLSWNCLSTNDDVVITDATGATTTASTTGSLDVTFGTAGDYTYALDATANDASSTPIHKTATLTVTSSGGGSSGGSGGGSSSGGGGSISPVVTTTTTPVTTTTPTTTTTTTTTTTGGGQVLGASTYNFASYLHQGSTGADVAALQAFLVGAGFSIPDAVTTYFGSETFAAVKAFQKAHGLPSTGYVGSLTLALLNQGVIPTTPETSTTVTTTTSSLTVAQVNSILGLLQSFGADASVIANVKASLGAK